MVATRDFEETVATRLSADAEFRRAMLRTVAESFIEGDSAIGRMTLGSYVRGTIGYKNLAKALSMRPRRLQRRLRMDGDLSSDELSRILQTLQRREGISLEVVISDASS